MKKTIHVTQEHIDAEGSFCPVERAILDAFGLDWISRRDLEGRQAVAPFSFELEGAWHEIRSPTKEE
jgi:hypothetical protein